MPPTRQRNTPANQEIADSLTRLERALNERDLVIAERFDRLDAKFDELINLISNNAERVATTEVISSFRAPQGIITGTRIPKPSRCYGKEGFFRFLGENLPEPERYDYIFQRVSQVALACIQNMRNEHPELCIVQWEGVGHHYKLELAENTLKIVLDKLNELEIIKRCPDLWP